MLIPIAIKSVAVKGLGKSLLIAQKYGPEILTGVGVVGVVTAGVLAARATLKLEETVDKAQTRVETVKELGGKNGGTSIYKSETAYKQDLTMAHIRGAFEIVKLYGPSVTLAVGSVACIIGAHGIMRKRNVALVAAYNLIEKSFSEYRGRVIDEFGEDKDRELRFGTITENKVNPETGKKEKVTSIDPNGYSLYSRFFDEGNINYSPEYNLLFLKCQQNYANDILHARGHIFLNEIYDLLGLERSKEGAVVGWILSKEGDNFIDFGIFNGRSEQARNFVNGYEPSILLDFNVDGVIFDKI